MIKKYNEENIYNFLMDEESIEKLHRAQLKTAKEKAIEQGLEQGLERGLEQGLEQGYEQGVEVTKNETALSLIKEKIPLDIISRTTGYSQEYLKSIKI